MLGSLAVTGLLFLSDKWRVVLVQRTQGLDGTSGGGWRGRGAWSDAAWWLVALVFRWRFQFGIRTLLVLVVAVALPFSWLAVEMRRAATQRRLANEVSASGFFVLYDNYFMPGKPTSLVLPTALAWLRNHLGDDFFTSVISVFVRGQHVADVDLDRLQGLTKLWQLDLEGSMATDATLEHVGRLVQLGILNLKNTEVTDSGLPSLRGLTQLHELSLGGTKVTDAGVKNLQQALPKCKIIH